VNSLLVRMIALYFLIMCSLGILKPLKNAFALVGLQSTHFYRVYFISALVVLFVPLYNRLAERYPLQRLIAGIALVFGVNLLLFRLLYQEGSVVYSLIFYGWYDLFAAVAVTQFFIAAQYVFNTREARSAYPLVIGGGAIGATLGGAITGFSTPLIGAPNLLLVAAIFLVGFGLVLPRSVAAEPAQPGSAKPSTGSLSVTDLRGLAAEPHIRLIGITVLLGVLVKQLVDYQFNTITGEVFVTSQAISAFQGKFNAATQWLPLLALLLMRPLLQRWGVGLLLFLLPVALMTANLGLALWWGLGSAVVAKAMDTSLRHTADRASREILYLPVPERIKLKAKVYIDIALEEGFGKLLSAVLILVLIGLVGYRNVGYVAVGITLLWLVAVVAVRQEYVRTLARSIEGRFASWRGLFTGVADASTLPVLRRALDAGDPVQTAFALDLIEQHDAAAVGLLSGELHRLLEHDEPAIRHQALTTLTRYPEALKAELVRRSIHDADGAVREAAIHALCAAQPQQREELLDELLGAPESAIRTAALSAIRRGAVEPAVARHLCETHIARCRAAGFPVGTAIRLEVALAVALLPADAATRELLGPLLSDQDAEVRSAAVRSAGALADPAFHAGVVTALLEPSTREAAREALLAAGPTVVHRLARDLLDENTDPELRRQLPGVLGSLRSQSAVDALLASAVAPERDVLLDLRTLRMLSKLRVRQPTLQFDAGLVREVVERDLRAAARYSEARPTIQAHAQATPSLALLARTIAEAWAERRERLFRCLGLLHPPEEVYRCYLAIAGGNPKARANALEWLEHTLGYAAFVRFEPVLGESTAPLEGPPMHRVLDQLATDADAWIALCARRVRQELLEAATRVRVGEEAARAQSPRPRAAGKPILRLPISERQLALAEEDDMNLLEKVFLLQQVDLLHGARSAHLALLASIADEVEVSPGTVLLRQGEPTDALYIVIAGAIELKGVGEQVLVARNGTPFGTWALIDEAPSLVSARALEPSHLLRITRHDFYDLLADHHEIAQGLLQGLARRVRTLVS
jgi:ATP:ADP antiporter, AAA family